MVAACLNLKDCQVMLVVIVKFADVVVTEGAGDTLKAIVGRVLTKVIQASAKENCGAVEYGFRKVITVFDDEVTGPIIVWPDYIFAGAVGWQLARNRRQATKIVRIYIFISNIPLSPWLKIPQHLSASSFAHALAAVAAIGWPTVRRQIWREEGVSTSFEF